MIEVDSLSKRFGQLHAVHNINLKVRPGEIFGFLGVNGAGKTTTIRMLAGVLKPTSGKVTICGYSLEDDAIEAKKIIGYIPDRPYLYNKLTGREILYFMADLYGVKKSSVDDRIDELLSDYQLTEWQDNLTESYSHGMKQRLATCAALLHRPKVFIVDEPMVGLDPHGARLLKNYLRKYASEGMTIFLSTHSLNVAEEVADRLAIIHKGSLISVGSLEEIRNQTGGLNGGLEEIFLELTANLPSQ